LLTVNDLTEDDRFANNPLVSSAPNIRFYAGMPLISPDGAAVGTICAVDFEKREISQSQKEALRRLSRQVMAQLELRRALKEADNAVKKREELYQALLSEKQALDQFMANMLPASIAEELKRDGKVEPKYIDEASIMFCDFVGFTKLTETMSPQNLIDLLHQCLCMAALEMIDYLNKTNQTREKLRMPTWDMRIGIHSGPVIAGVVGENKFTFDVWGDAVNIAALMEQNSERGRVNVSESTEHRVSQQFQLEDRGLVHTGKKGDLRMFFLS
jgi:class 3 adenylate cyclase